MANLSKVVKIRKSDYESLITNGSVVINETTHTYDPLAAYIIVDPLIDAVQGVKVNGTDLAIDQNGAVDVLLALSSGYTKSSALTKDTLSLHSGLTYEESFGNLEQIIAINEEVTARSLVELKDNVNNIVIPVASNSNPLMDGSVSVGTSSAYARGDHRHPRDTSRAPIASPSFTGTPTAPTAASGTSTTQIATTAFVHNVLSGMPSDVMWVNFSAGANITCDTSVSNIVTALNEMIRILHISICVHIEIFDASILMI